MTDITIPESWKPLIEAGFESIKGKTFYDGDKSGVIQLYAAFLTAFLNEAVKAGLAKRANAVATAYDNEVGFVIGADEFISDDEADFPALILNMGDEHGRTIRQRNKPNDKI